MISARFVAQVLNLLKLIYTLISMRIGLLFLIPAIILFTTSQLSSNPVKRIPRDELLEAMRSQSGYDPTATTNVARFQSGVLLELASKALESDSTGSVLFIDHEDWLKAFMSLTGLTEATLPICTRLAYEYQQDLLFDFREGHVIERVEEGTEPELAMNVIVGWPPDTELPRQYSFDDTLSTPNLKVTNHRQITFRLLDFGHVIVYDEIEGLTGRPTSGLLGILFKIIGEGRVVHSRIAISKDGLQINRANAKKGPFSVNETVTVQPDGVSEKGLPEDRQDLEAVETLLKQTLEIEYLPLEFEEIEEVWQEFKKNDGHLDEDRNHE